MKAETLKTIAIPADLHADLSELALSDGRTVGKQATLLLRAAITRKVTTERKQR
jgi:hypothetical protein